MRNIKTVRNVAEPELAVCAGVDPSINSTGVAVRVGDRWDFYVVSGKLTKKQTAAGVLQFPGCTFRYVCVPKRDLPETYEDRERAKTTNIVAVADAVKEILSRYDSPVIGMEGISYGSVSRTTAIYDLAGLNYLLRDRLGNVCVVSPSDNKKFATGKGNATKEVMQAGFAAVFPGVAANVKKYDDVADAYWLALCAANKMRGA